MSKGFNNIGNSCYLNSGLQMLIQNKDFCKKIYNNRHVSNNLKEMTDFIFEYYDNESKKPITPRTVKRMVEIKRPMFRGSKQHDSEEFFISLIEILNNESILNTLKLQNKFLTSKTNDITFEKSIKSIFDDYEKNKITIEKLLMTVDKIQKDFISNNEITTCLPDINDTGLKKIFEFEIRKELQCYQPECLHERYVSNKEIILTLPINDDSKTLDDCYNEFKITEILKDDEMVHCDKCNKKQITSNKLRIKVWPSHLIICLNRYKNFKRMLSKINNDISIPFEWKHNYKIKGAVIHMGNVGGGHYIYIGRNIEKDNWTVYDDTNTSEISNSKATLYLNKAYILYFVQ